MIGSRKLVRPASPNVKLVQQASPKVKPVAEVAPEGSQGGASLLAPLDQKFCATPKICKKLVCSSKTVDFRAVFGKTALESTVFELQGLSL